MEKLKIIQELEALELKRINLEKLKDDANNYYTKGMGLIVIQDSQNFNKRYEGEKVPINIDIFRDYLDREIGFVEVRTNELVKN